MKRVLAVLVILYTSTSVQASRVDWEIQFFNEVGIQVGSGDFSYNPDTTDTYTTYSGSIYDVPPTEYSQEVITTFTNLNLIVNSEQWFCSDPCGVWWGGSNNHYGGAGRYGFHDYTLGHFLLGSIYSGPSSFRALV